MAFWEDFVRRSKSEHVILLRDPDDRPASRFTEKQIESFHTGFEGWSVTRLRRFFHEFVCADEQGRSDRDELRKRHGEAVANIDTFFFAVIDEETVQEGKSVAMHYYGLSDFAQDDDWQWSEWRVALDGAQHVWHCMVVKAGCLLWEGGADEDGLLRCPG